MKFNFWAKTKNIEINVRDAYLDICRRKNEILTSTFVLQVLVLLDVTPDQSMLDEGVAREVINRIQKLRKKVGRLFEEHYYIWKAEWHIAHF